MTITDIILISAVVVFTLVWWMRGMGARAIVLSLSALLALVAGVAGVLEHRWQNAAGATAAVVFLVLLLIDHRRRKILRTGIPWISGAVITVLTVLTIIPVFVFPATDLPPPSGKYAVGTRDFELVDKSRLGVLAAGAGAPRRLLVRVWYPAGDISGLQRRPYFTEAEVETTATGLGRLVNAPFLFQYIRHSTTHSFIDAPLPKRAKDLPVLVYSHGYTSFAGQNTALMEELASHGYAVYSVQHTYDSSPTVFPNGDIAETDPSLFSEREKSRGVSKSEKMAFAGATLDERYQGQMQHRETAIARGDRLITRSASIWLRDRIFVLDELERGAVPTAVSEIVAASDFSRTGQLGMSFGGSTSGGLCMIDTRCAAVVNLDGGDFHGAPFGSNIPVPFMMLYSDFDFMVRSFGGDENALRRGLNDFSYERHEAAGLRDDIYRFQITGVKHLGVSDFTWFTRSPARDGLFGPIDADAMIQIQNDFVRGFFDTHLLGLSVGFPEKQYAAHRPWVKRDDISDIKAWWLQQHPQDRIERVVLETSLGDLELALYPERDPIAAPNFLAHVNSGHFKGASLCQPARGNAGYGTLLFHSGGLAAATIETEGAHAEPETVLSSSPPKAVAHTHISEGRGAIACAELAPGSPSMQFVYPIEDNQELDGRNITRGQGEQSQAAIGRVLRGLRLLEHTEPLSIRNAYRISAD